MTKIVAISDMHGQLPQPQTIPDSDILLIAGDVCCHGKAPAQLHWLNSKFRNWLKKVDRPVIATAGNHDWAMYDELDKVRKLNLPWTYLQDEATVYNGLTVYASPWQKEFFSWAFNLNEHELMGKWNLIPDETDILICHSPPKFCPATYTKSASATVAAARSR
jgi:Icc-related predicted phosphoesterase